MQKFLLPLLVLLGLTGCQSQPALSQTNPIQPIPTVIPAPLVCTMQYDPVCATLHDNGLMHQQTFGNRCMANGAKNLVSLRQGECSTSPNVTAAATK